MFPQIKISVSGAAVVVPHFDLESVEKLRAYLGIPIDEVIVMFEVFVMLIAVGDYDYVQNIAIKIV